MHSFACKTTNDDSCTICKKTNVSERMEWSQCHHIYCSSCATDLIAQHLSSFNKIPACIHRECNEPLDVTDIPSLYETAPSFHEYSRHKVLMEGYINNIGVMINIPNAILSLISEYYHLNLHKPASCTECTDFLRVPLSKSSSEYLITIINGKIHMTLNELRRLKIGDVIDHRDEFGRFRRAAIVDKLGTDLRIHYESDIYPMYKSLVYDKWSDFSIYSELKRFAKYNSITNRKCSRKEFKFNEIRNDCKVKIRPPQEMRWRDGQIEEIDERSAQVGVRHKYGTFWTHLDNVSEIKRDKSEMMHCSRCNGDKVYMALDLRKICKTQLQCIMCNKYHPRHSIMHWSNCQHVICVDCSTSYVRGFVTTYGEIPICPAVDCAQHMGENNFNFMSCHYVFVVLNKDIYWKIKMLFNLKNRFECVYCRKWHDNKEVCEDIDCEHKYSAKCRNIWSHKKYGDSDCPRCLGKCELCQEYDYNKKLRRWALCGHKYHKHCAQLHIRDCIPQERMFLGDIFCKKMIPLCVNKDCGSFLDVECAKIFRITRYQMEILNELRNEITFIADADDDDHFDDEWVQIDFEDIEGFEACG